MKLLPLFFCLIVLLSERGWASSSGGEGVALIRDAEIDDVLRSFADPLFKAAKLNPNSMSLYVINSPDINAFATGGSIIVLHSALLLRATSVLQVIGVLAHETAHVANNHIALGRDAYETAVLQNLLGTIGGIAVGAASGKPEAGAAILMGTQEAATRLYLTFSRTQEGSADQGAVRYLDSLGWPSDGLLDFINLLHHGEIMFVSEQSMDPYLRTHPLLTERIDFFRSHISKSPYRKAAFPRKFEDDFKRIQVKLKAFTQPPLKTLNEYPLTDKSLVARYGRAIAYFQNTQPEESLKELNGLLKDYPNDTFFWDLKGQIFFESGKMREAVKAYEKAVTLRPDIPLLSITLAHALIESGDKANLEKAYPLLLRAKTEEPDNTLTHRLLGVYYGKKGNMGLSALSLAEMALQAGDFGQAAKQATRAMHFLKGDEANLTRAQDILAEVERQSKPPSGPF